jgi:hypothetical protein
MRRPDRRRATASATARKCPLVHGLLRYDAASAALRDHVAAATRRPSDNEGRSASAGASRGERGCSTPQGITVAWWPLRRKFGASGAGAELPLSRLQLARCRLAAGAPGVARSAVRPGPWVIAEMRACGDEQGPQCSRGTDLLRCRGESPVQSVLGEPAHGR